MDDADRALQSENDRQMGPRPPELVEQIDKAHVIACRNLREEFERCLEIIGPDTMRQFVAGLAKRFGEAGA